MFGIVYLFAATLEASRFTLAERDQPAAVTVVADAGASYVHAANELRDYTRRMTGVSLPVVCVGTAVLGRSIRLVAAKPSDKCGDDGFCLKVEGENLVITGGKRGILYGVYEILETYGGCGWYAADCEVVPECASFSVPRDLNRVERPAFVRRRCNNGYTEDPDFYTRARLNDGVLSPRQREEKYGGTMPDFDDELGICHTFHKAVDPKTYFKDHPEYFSEKGGKRIETETQLCLTNPDVLRLTIEKVIARIRANRAAGKNVHIYGISQNDWKNPCMCPRCAAVDEREGSPSGTIIDFVNKVAEAAEKEDPEVIIETLAYQYSRIPPKTIRPRDNVMVALCLIELDFSKPIPDSRFEANVRLGAQLAKWREITQHLYVWNYDSNWRYSSLPHPNLDTLVPNIKYFRMCGVTDLFENFLSANPANDFFWLKNWLVTKAMWNPDIDVAAHVRRFTDVYYGPAAPFVREYLKRLSADPRNEAKNPLCWDTPPAGQPYTDAFLSWAIENWDAAEKAVAQESEHIRTRIRWARFSADYARAERFARTGQPKSKRTEAVSAAKRVMAALAFDKRAFLGWDFSWKPRSAEEIERVAANRNAWHKEDFIVGTTDREIPFYEPNEKMTFTFGLHGFEGLDMARHKFAWTRSGDDGVRASGSAPVDRPLVLTTSLDRPGFIRYYVELQDSDGKVIERATDEKKVFFDGGAGVDVFNIRPAVPAPRDFEDFWRNSKARLAKVEWKNRETVARVDSGRDDVDLYTVSVPCAGGKPVTGFLSVPKLAKDGVKYPAEIGFSGYNASWTTFIHRPEPSRLPKDRILFIATAHGFELMRDQAYYSELRKQAGTNGYDFGFDPVQNADPEKAYFRGMTFRVMRALEYIKSRPEWNGRDLVARGGSMGGLQSIWAGALDGQVTEVNAEIPWCCDIGGETIGRNRGEWYVHWVPALGYYDPVNVAKLIGPTCRVRIARAGLGDYICPPTGVMAFYNSLTCPKGISLLQNSTHAYLTPRPRYWTLIDGTKIDKLVLQD